MCLCVCEMYLPQPIMIAECRGQGKGFREVSVYCLLAGVTFNRKKVAWVYAFKSTFILERVLDFQED